MMREKNHGNISLFMEIFQNVDRLEIGTSGSGGGGRGSSGGRDSGSGCGGRGSSDGRGRNGGGGSNAKNIPI